MNDYTDRLVGQACENCHENPATHTIVGDYNLCDGCFADFKGFLARKPAEDNYTAFVDAYAGDTVTITRSSTGIKTTVVDRHSDDAAQVCVRWSKNARGWSVDVTPRPSRDAEALDEPDEQHDQDADDQDTFDGHSNLR